MKILVFSDSHGAYSKLERAAALHPDAGMIIFLGDGLRDAERLFEGYPLLDRVAVKGNCDLGGIGLSDTYLDEQTAEIAGKRIFCCHGHKYNVKFTQMNLWFRAREKEADIALFGHTHDPFERREDGLLLFNPGSVAQGSYGIIYIENGAVLASHGKI
ncbi:MAG: metallophosphoesterase [Clostridia bacterium]|nr:metallophosphoesterase [Clostridia bacterium]